MMNEFLVSVIIPAFNAQNFLERAIQSVVNQTHQNLEVIVVDDGSTDHTVSIASKQTDSRIQVLQQHNQGAGAARNKGVKQATGDFLAFLDADDYWSLSKLEQQLALLVSRPDVDLCFGMVQEWADQQLIEESLTNPERRLPHLRTMRGISLISMLGNTSAVKRVGPFREDLTSGEFLDWYLRAKQEELKTEVLPEVVAFRRVHAGNRGRSRGADAGNYPQILKSLIDQRKQGP